VRIRLSDDDRSHRDRPARHKRSKRRSGQAFQVALPMPQARDRRSGTRQRPAGRKATSATRERVRRRTTARGKRAESPVVQAPARPRASKAQLAVRLGALLFLVLLIAAAVYGSTDARFFVYQAGVVGARHLSAEAIYQAAGIDEQNIFWIDPAGVAQRILRLDGVKAARVRCQLPARVTIEVEERQPKVLWRIDGQKRDWWLDEEGVVLPYHGDPRAPEILFVVDSSQRELAFGEIIEPEGTVASVVKLAAALPQSRVFFYDGERGLSFTQRGEVSQWPVFVGSSEDLERKIQVMQTLTAYLQANGITPRYVDVRWAAHPVYGRPLGETAGGGQ
jgi:cell division septal protein FtsQ